MHARICTALVVASVMTTVTAAEDICPYDLRIVAKSVPGSPTELTEWLSSIRRDGFSLLIAVRQNDHFVAVFTTSNSELVVCEYAFRRNVSSALLVTDHEGTKLINTHRLRRTIEVQTDHFKSRIVILDGYLIPLPNPRPETIYIEYRVSSETEDQISDGKPHEIRTDQVVFAGSVEVK
ncbi:MAG: hypothetical protein ACYC0X_26555 [Pirellulaceae bacterium]